jgi:small subunit ribosomal protein S8
MNVNILKVMKNNGYIQNYEIITQGQEDKIKFLKVFLKYKNKVSVIQEIKRISKPGLRIYSQSSKLPKVLNGIGIAIVSTSQGVMSAKEAKINKLGGEILTYI